MFCPNCGNNVVNGVAFCPKCGMDLRQPVAANAQTPAGAPAGPVYRGQQPLPGQQPVVVQQTVVEKKQNIEGLIGLILTIVAPFFPPFAIPLLVLALILIFIGLFRQPRGTAIAGCLIWLVVVFFAIYVLGLFANMLT